MDKRQFRIELDWLLASLTTLAQGDKPQELNLGGIELSEPPMTFALDSYGDFIQAHAMRKEERLVLALALAAHLRPQILELLRLEGNPARLIQSPRSQVLMPTVETALWLIAGAETGERVEAMQIFNAEHQFYQKSVLEIHEPETFFPATSSALSISKRYFELFVHDKFIKPRFSQEFPAHLLETELSWQDLILNKLTRSKLDEVSAYLEFEEKMRTELGMDRHMRQGYRVLFHGPSGTGKSLAASLIGKSLGREVYRIDLSSIVSKYIGETSKNLNQLFNTAEGKNWILFFDEGDALFGQRQDNSRADGPGAQYANQDTAYLLQRIENYQGLIIVASNFKQNIDEAFTRRFQTMVHFDLPDMETAQMVWEANLPTALPLAPDINLPMLIRQHSLSQAGIIKVIQRAVLQSLMQSLPNISRQVLEKCVMDESLNFKNFRP